MLPEIGHIVAEKYRIEGRLGQGGMAVVFAAHHMLLDRPVAVKMLSPELPRTPQLVERFLAEARAAARVDSVYVARVIDVGELDDSPYIVMERLTGCDLDELRATHGLLPVVDVIDFALQALQGLAHAHVLGVIHRDLKPPNLFLAHQSDGTTLIKILDFGIAKLVDQACLGVRGQTLGSPNYMSPEQVRDAEQVDSRTDIWSMGVSLYELLTGRNPFEADGVGDTFAAVLERTPASVRSLRPEVPEELEAAIMRCLRQNPDERFTDVAELAAAIAPFGTGACAALVASIDQTLRQEVRRFTTSAVVSRPPISSIHGLASVRVAFGDDGDRRLSFLHGDGTPSGLQTNFIGFLADALDTCAKVLVADDALVQCEADVRRLERAANDEIDRLDTLAAIVKDSVEQSPTVGTDSPTARVVRAVVDQTEAHVRDETAQLRSTLDRDLADVQAREKAARDDCGRAYEALLLRHDLPGTTASLDLRLRDDQYVARIAGAVDFGLAWSIQLEIPSDHVFKRAARLEKISRLEVEAPELTGWIRKEMKTRPQRLDRLYVTELHASEASLMLKLRNESDGSGDGYDVDVDLMTARSQLARAGSSEAPYDLSEADVVKMGELHTKVLAIAKDLARSRKTLVEATIDGAPLWQGHAPKDVVDRLVTAMAPITREIATHSLSTTELVLKRVLGDDRREEVFVPKATLLARLDAVPERLRSTMTPIVLAIEAVGTRASQPSFPGIATS
jgi:serine/threonine protein kinase